MVHAQVSSGLLHLIVNLSLEGNLDLRSLKVSTFLDSYISCLTE